MAGGKETPRQKMIGMMYLVLTALLAMNVSKSILEAFVKINEGIIVTNEGFVMNNEKTYAAFEKAKAKDPKKTEPYYVRAMEAKKLSDQMVKYIEDLKKKLIMESDKKDEKAADTLAKKLAGVDAKDNYDIPSEIMIGSDPANPKDGPFTAKELKRKLNETRAALIKIFADEKLFLPGTQKEMDTKLGLRTPDFGVVNGTKETWETGYFEHVPLAAEITILSKFQSDVRNAESDVINKLYSAVSEGDFKFDQLVAKVIAPSSYVLAGDEYKADVLLVAYSSSTKPTIILGDVDTTKKGDGVNPLRGGGDSTSVPVEGGMGRYKKSTGGEGLQKWSGVIKVQKPGGGFNYYPFQSEYMVAKPAIAVSPTKMNVFYIGVDNPVDVSAAGVAPDNLVVNLGGQGAISGSKGKYTVRVNGGTEATVNVSAKFGSTTKPMGQGMKFRVKRIPDPYAFVNGQKGDISIKKGVLIASGAVIPKMEGFDFDLTPVISSFTMTVNIKGDLKEMQATGNKWTPDMIGALQKVGQGAKVYIENIKCRMPDGSVRNLPSVNCKVQL
jgi:gliding motility-associated protein GldM